MHGGAKGSGAPRGNQNALKHGEYTNEMLAMRRKNTEMVRAYRQTLIELGATIWAPP
jgi:uncharacterized protein YjcR